MKRISPSGMVAGSRPWVAHNSSSVSRAGAMLSIGFQAGVSISP